MEHAPPPPTESAQRVVLEHMLQVQAAKHPVLRARHHALLDFISLGLARQQPRQHVSRAVLERILQRVALKQHAPAAHPAAVQDSI